MRVRHIQDVHAMAARALERGARRKSMSTVEWIVSGDCLSPYWSVYYGRPEANRGRYFAYEPGGPAPMAVEIATRCRKCDRCLAARRSEWEIRARYENQRAVRSWFGTITIAPEYRTVFELRAKYTAVLRGTEAGDGFAALHREVSLELTKFLKRVRKASNARFKYLLVAEAHKDGWPHYHVLVHEQDASLPIRKRVFQSQWSLGFTSLKLVKSEKAIMYVCKYISKSNMARVRASVAYGKARSQIVVERDKGVDPQGLRKGSTDDCSKLACGL